MNFGSHPAVWRDWSKQETEYRTKAKRKEDMPSLLRMSGQHRDLYPKTHGNLARGDINMLLSRIILTIGSLI